MPPALFLLGPTATGKTALALALTKRFPLEIISVDSALIYRDMNIGTAKPDADMLKKFPHHLVNIIDPTDSYSAARFRDDALRVMADITARGKVPLLTGGTMLYVKVLTEGLSAMPVADTSIREALDQRAAKIGWPAMHGELAKIDPITAQRLMPNDSQRIQRALEVYKLSGTPLSALQNKKPGDAFAYDALKIALIPYDRAALHQRIATRFEAMLEQGLIEEVEQLRTRYALHPDMPSMRCVGYRQVWEYLEGDSKLDALRESSLAATRQLAKRQMTWLRAMAKIEAFDCLRDDVAEQIITRTEKFLAGRV